MVKVWQASDDIVRDTFFFRKEGKVCNPENIREFVEQKKYTEVATFGNDVSLEDAYFKTQNIDEPWRPDSPCRSTSVGDIIVKGGIMHVVSGFGFYELGAE